MKYRSIGKCIAVIHKNLNYYINKQFEEYNINRDQIEILHTLNSNEGISQNELGRKILDDKITITKKLNGLEKEGYIERKVDKEDKRIKKLYLTNEGKEITKISKKILDDSSRMLLENIPKEKEEELKEILIQMSENAFKTVKNIKKFN